MKYEAIPITPPLYIGGPTAVGKSQVALSLAERLGGEILSVDSMQVYRGMDIGTDKPTAAEQQRVPHHLIDLVPVTHPFDVAQYVVLAHQAEQAVRKRGRLPIFCGGTGLYIKAFLEGIGDAPPPDPGLREELEATELADLLEELYRLDPETYHIVDRRNARRVIRAVEVCRLTGRPFSEQKAHWSHNDKPDTPAKVPRSQPFCFGLTRAAADLEHRLSHRVDQMFNDGLVDETRRLLEAGLAKNRSAMQALGYRQAIDYLEGKRSLADTVAHVKRRTRLFTKRQLTWFRHQMRLNWLTIARTTSTERVAERIAEEFLRH